MIDLAGQYSEIFFGGAVLSHHLVAVYWGQVVLVVVEGKHSVSLYTAVF